MPRGKKKIEEIKEEVLMGIIAENGDVYTPDGQKVETLTTSVDIIDEAGNLVRTYSLADHGENFQSLADSFILGHPNCHKQ